MFRILFALGMLAIAEPAVAQSSGVDLDLVKSAASATFDKLDINHDGTLDAKELHGRISKKDWRTADPDNDKTITKDEYLAYVEALFKQADTNGEGKLEGKELRSPAARKLERLLK
jgi:Ca2+-binding EF-hand superfamily protein